MQHGSSVSLSFTLVLVLLLAARAGQAATTRPLTLGISWDALPIAADSLPMVDKLPLAFDLLGLNANLDRFRSLSIGADRMSASGRDWDSPDVKRLEAAQSKVLDEMVTRLRGLSRAQAAAARSPFGKLLCAIQSDPSPAAVERAMGSAHLGFYLLNSAARRLEELLERDSGTPFRIRVFRDEQSLVEAAKTGRIDFAFLSGPGAAWNHADRSLQLLATAALTKGVATRGYPPNLPSLGVNDPALSRLEGYDKIRRLKSLIPADLYGTTHFIDWAGRPLLRSQDLDRDLIAKRKLLGQLKAAEESVIGALTANPEIAATTLSPEPRNHEAPGGQVQEELDRQFQDRLRTAKGRDEREKWTQDYHLRRELAEVIPRINLLTLRLTERGMKKLVAGMEHEPLAVDLVMRRRLFWSLALLEGRYGQGSPTGFAASSLSSILDSHERPDYLSSVSKAISMEGTYPDGLTLVPDKPMPRIPAGGIWYSDSGRLPGPFLAGLQSNLFREGLFGGSISDFFDAAVFGPPTASYSQQLQAFRRQLPARPKLGQFANTTPGKSGACFWDRREGNSDPRRSRSSRPTATHRT